MNEVEDKYYKKLKEIELDLYYDKEMLHIEMDNVLVELLRELGYKKIANYYEDVKEYFWYA